MVIEQCDACRLVQISNPVPAIELLPHYDWITYNEPEGHLDHLVEIISNLPGLTRDSAICGISFKDDSTLMRLANLGFGRTWRIDPESNLGISDSIAGVETIQDRLTPETANMIAQKHGVSDVIIVRHILEHAHDALNFLGALKKLVNPDGYIVFEVPDCARGLEKCDYNLIWEEHVLYFTPETFRHCLAVGGFSLVHFECYPYPLEDSIVGIAQLQNQKMPFSMSEDFLRKEKSGAEAYFRGLPESRDKFKKLFSEYQRNEGKIALFGAGHLACTFVNLLDVKNYIEFIVDDSPNKRGLFMPGSRLPIYESAVLVEQDIKLCLLSVAPQSEDKVIGNNQLFLERGGAFSSIFPASQHALQI